jgi:hypothetical protein
LEKVANSGVEFSQDFLETSHARAFGGTSDFQGGPGAVHELDHLGEGDGGSLATESVTATQSAFGDEEICPAEDEQDLFEKFQGDAPGFGQFLNLNRTAGITGSEHGQSPQGILGPFGDSHAESIPPDLATCKLCFRTRSDCGANPVDLRRLLT